MSDPRIHKQLFYVELSQERLPKKRLKDNLKVSFKDFSINTESCRPPFLAQNHPHKSKDSQGKTDPVSRAETPDTEAESHQHQQHSPYKPLSNLWERLPCPIWPLQPSPDSQWQFSKQPMLKDLKNNESSWPQDYNILVFVVKIIHNFNSPPRGS